MKLKSLEIEGFKSFSNKTRLVFEQSVTGIVGPNGCGKSNVVDAIRWVMGEQSAKHLRGKNMEDVIFSGAQDRGASGLASVELTFLTEGAQTPPQYENLKEISIGRKLYRSGESEYFVNKQSVRLKDVRDLFLGTGLGGHAYSIIEQGSIGQLVTAKPEDRRKIVEEAAGISKFQIRKEAAERKMEGTQQNLLRLRDILTELERQKSALERQAKKAEKFKLIKDELTQLDLAIASVDYQTLNSGQETILERMRQVDAEHVAAEAALQENENLFEEHRLTLTEAERELADLQQAVYECDNALSIAENRLHHKREESERLGREAADEVVRCDGLVTQIVTTETLLSEANSGVIAADLDFATHSENVQTLEQTHQNSLQSAQTLFTEIETARRQHHEVSKRLVELQSQLRSSTQRFEELQKKWHSDASELEEITSKHKQLATLLHETQADLSDVKQLKFTLGERTSEVAAQLTEVEASVVSEQNILSDIKEKLLQKKSRLASLEELERNFEGYQDGPKALLEKRREGRLDSVLGAVADFVETEPLYEGAVSAVLGERMQCLVVNTQTDSVQCAEFLKTASSGRGSFISIQQSEAVCPQPRALLHAEAVSGYKGYLVDFVRAKSGYDHLKMSLLNDYVLVEKLGDALEFWQTLRQPVVTLDGEVISADGMLSGGTLEKTSKALLEKKREIKILQEETNELVGQVKAKEELCFDLNRKLRALKAELEQVTLSRHEEELKITRQEKDAAHCQREIEALNERRQRLADQVLRTDENMESLQQQIVVLKESQKSEDEVLKAAEGVLITKKSEEEFYKNHLREQQDVLTAEKIKLAQAREQKMSFEKEANRLQDTLTGLQQAKIASEEKRVYLQKKAVFHAERIRFFEKNISRILGAKKTIDDSYNEAKNKFEDLNQKTLTQELQVKEWRRTHERCKDELNQLALQLAEMRGQLTRLKEVIFERYQLALPDIFSETVATLQDFDRATSTERAEELREQMARAGSVNLEAIDELRDVTTRFDFLDKQRIDLEDSLAALSQAIQKINQTTKRRFVETFELINEKFSHLFPKLFEGGEAHLKLTDPENILETGVDIIAQPPGKKLQSISLLSGGEKALTAVSLLFAIFLIKPSPFCLLDEVDAPLDDANVDRYNDIVREMSQRTQFIVITHNKRTMQMTDSLYGVTMEKSGISQLVSVNLG